MSKLVSLSEAGSIAIHSMVMIARSDESLNVLRIADKTASSKHHISKILQRLVKSGFLKSTRGPAGGFALNKSPEQITLLDIYQAIEGEIIISGGSPDKLVCPFDTCMMGNIIPKLTEEFRDFLKSKKLSDFIVKGITV